MFRQMARWGAVGLPGAAGGCCSQTLRRRVGKEGVGVIRVAGAAGALGDTRVTPVVPPFRVVFRRVDSVHAVCSRVCARGAAFAAKTSPSSCSPACVRCPWSLEQAGWSCWPSRCLYRERARRHSAPTRRTWPTLMIPPPPWRAAGWSGGAGQRARRGLGLNFWRESQREWRAVHQCSAPPRVRPKGKGTQGQRAPSALHVAEACMALTAKANLQCLQFLCSLRSN